MSENNVIGRWPFERWTVKQDFCNLVWSEGVCYAGRTNFLPLSEDILNLSGWESGSGYDVTSTTIIGPDGDASATEVTYNPSGLEGAVIDSIPDTPSGQGDSVYGSISAKMKSGSQIDAIFLQLEVDDPPFEYAGYGISIVDGSTDLAQDEDAISYLDVSDQGDGWWRIEIGVTREFLSQNSRLRIQPYNLSTGAKPDPGEAVYLDQPMVTDIQGQEYAGTTGESITAVSDKPCNNTRSTCQVPDVYDRGVLPLHFAKPQQELIKGEYIRPSVVSSTITPGKINPGGTNASSSPLGERATISVTFQDHADSDRLVDPYVDQRDYDPLERGTFWTKWRARNPYYMHRELVYESGYLVDGQIVDSITRTFFITGFSGPDASGRVTISGKDALTLANNDKAKAPIASQGKLDADITDVATSIVLTPTGIGDLEYPTGTPFWVRIGKEIIEVTRTGGSDTLSVNNRGTYGTAAEAHDQGDTAQLCLVYDAEDPATILYDLLLNYANIPDAFLDKTQWDAEVADYIPNLYSTLISDPTGVATLVGEMCQQMFFTVWFDERDSLVRIRAVRSAQGDAVTELDDDRHLLSDSISWKDKAEELVTQVWIRYARINAAEKLDEPSNYAVTEVVASLDSESADKNNISRVKEIYSRWIPSTGSAAALELGQAILARFGSAPRECTFMLDAKDRDLWLADFIRLTNRQRVDRFGLPQPVAMQVYEAQEAVAGSKFKYKAQEYVAPLTDGDVVSDPDDVTFTITTDHLNVNLRDWWDSNRGDAPDGKTITFVIPSGVTIGGYSTDSNVNIQYGQRITSNDFYDGGTGSVSGLNAGQIPILQRQGIGTVRTTNSGVAYPDGGGNADFKIIEYPVSTALDTGTWPVDVTLNLVIEAGGRLLGEGGNGSAHGLSGNLFTRSGLGGTTSTTGKRAAKAGDGGHGMVISHPITITNNGVISCGAGGGGAALAVGSDNQDPTEWSLTPGGGGAGLEISDTTTVITRNGPQILRQPSSGSTTDGGSGGRSRINREASITGYRLINTLTGGAGAALNGDGASASFAVSGTGISSSTHTGGQGGTAGDAIASGADLVTWVNKGDVRGNEVI